MEFKKLKELSAVELKAKKSEIEKTLTDLLTSTSLTNLKKDYKKSLARINTLLSGRKNNGKC